MSSAISEILDRIPPFKHIPLDHTQPSIRIINVLPNLSPEGLVQCTLTHGSTDDDYTCLSYTWGEEGTACSILMDHQLFSVRQNLHDFLHVVRKKYPLRPFWIDAICIDQYTITERNHQVTQMGAIYTAAAHVMVWMGNSSKIAEFFRRWNQNSQSRSSPYLCWMSTEDKETTAGAGWIEFTNHAYWTRAWITQEIAHSSTLSLLADVVEVHHLDGIDRIPWFSYTRAELRFRIHIDIATRHHAVLGKPLVSLLEMFPNQECQNPRDRVYSLLGLAAEGANICVDYASSDMDFVLKLSRACEGLEYLRDCDFIPKMLDVVGTPPIALKEVKVTRLTLPAISTYIFQQGILESCSITQQTDISLLHHRDVVLNFKLHRGSCRLEVVRFAKQEMKQPIGRFTCRIPPRYRPQRKGGVWPESRYSACQQGSIWWPGPETNAERCASHDFKSMDWQPDSEDRHHGGLEWYEQPGAERIISNWFPMLLTCRETRARTRSRVRTRVIVEARAKFYDIGIPLSAWCWFVQQLRLFQGLNGRSRPGSFPDIDKGRLSLYPVAWCKEVVVVRDALKTEQPLTLDDDDDDSFEQGKSMIDFS